MKQIHQVYKAWALAKSRGLDFEQLMGKWQYIYSSDKGKISLIKLKNYFRDNIDLWEIYSLGGKLFEDVERFNSKKEAEIRIKELLD